jgi:hypothetical protein
MNSVEIRSFWRRGVAVSCTLLGIACTGSNTPTLNQTNSRAAPPLPSALSSSAQGLSSIPALRSGPEAPAAAKAFVTWASGSTAGDRQATRAALAAVRGQPEIARALGEEAFASLQTDKGRTLVALALLGELRSPVGAEYLKQIAHLPLPQAGTLIEGKIQEQTDLEVLQMKAIDGLAYLNTPEGDAEVLEAVKNNPSLNVRAEAIHAFQASHGFSDAARETLHAQLRPGDEAYLDRLQRQPQEDVATFNERIAAYAAQHPAVLPERVQTVAPKSDQDSINTSEPPSARP